MRGPDIHNSAIGENDLGGNDVIGGRAVNGHVRAGGIVRDHSADCRARARRDIRTETKSMGFEKRIELVEHHARADAYRTIVDIEIVDLAIVPREIDDQPVADRVPDQTRAGAAWCDRNIFVRGGADDRAGFVGAARKRHANWLDLIN